MTTRYLGVLSIVFCSLVAAGSRAVWAQAKPADVRAAKTAVAGLAVAKGLEGTGYFEGVTPSALLKAVAQTVQPPDAR